MDKKFLCFIIMATQDCQYYIGKGSFSKNIEHSLIFKNIHELIRHLCVNQLQCYCNVEYSIHKIYSNCYTTELIS